jgi:hypothetical protein
MKRILFAVLLLAASALSLPAASIALDFAPNTVGVGNNFDVFVKVTGVFDGRPSDLLFGFGFTPFISDLSKVTFVGATVNTTLFDDLSAGGVIMGSHLPPYPAGGLTEPLTLATLTFQAVGSGLVNVGINSDLTDFAQGLLYSLDSLDITTSGSIDIAPVPEPAAAALFAPALAALLLAARRRRYNC